MATYDGSIRFDTRIDEKGFNQGIDSLVSGFKRLAAQAGIAVGAFTIIKNSIKSALDYIGNDAVYIRTMGEWKDATQEFTEDLKAKMGISRSEMRNFMATMYNMTTSMGIGSKEAYTMSKSMALLAQDMAAFHNISSEEALAKIRSGLTGSSEAVANWGINLKQSAIEQEANRLGLNNLGRELTETEKVMLRYNVLMQQTANAQGYLAETMDTPNARIRILKDSIRTLTQDLGQLFIPILQIVIPILNGFVIALTRAVGAIASFFGIKIGTALTNSLVGASNSANNFANSMGVGANNINKSAKGAKKLREEMSKLAGFDKLNVLSSNKDSESSGGVGAGGGAGIGNLAKIDMPEYPNFLDNEKLKESRERLEGIVKTIETLSPLIGGILSGLTIFYAARGIEKMIPKIQEAMLQWKLFKMELKDGKPIKDTKLGVAMMAAGVVTLVTSLSKLINNWDEMTTKEKVITGVFAVIGAAAIALGYAIATGISVATLGIGAIIAAVVALVTALGSFIYKIATEEKAILSTAEAQERYTEAKEAATEATNEYVSAIDKSEEAMKNLNAAEKETGLSGQALFEQVEKGTLDYKNMNAAQRKVYKAYLENAQAEKDLTEATETLTEAKKTEKEAHWDNELALAAEEGNYDKYKKAVVDAYNSGQLKADEAQVAISKAMTEMSLSGMQTFTEDLPTAIQDGLKPEEYMTFLQKFSLLFKNNFEGTRLAAKYVWDKIKSGAKDAWEGIKNTFASIPEWFKKKFTDAWENVKRVFSVGGKIFTKIKDAITNSFKSVVNGIIDGLNRVIAKPFGWVNSILNKIKSISIAGVQPFYKFWGWNPITVPQIPRLATGAVIPPNAEFLAILGDQKHGRNIETPERLLREIMQEELEEIGKGMMEILVPVNVYLDGKKMSEHTIKYMYNKEELEGTVTS